MSKITFNDEQISYMKNTKEFVQGKRCYELELPWMDSEAIVWLNNLKSNYNCLEFGSGGLLDYIKTELILNILIIDNPVFLSYL